jgi:hypothetical protein
VDTAMLTGLVTTTRPEPLPATHPARATPKRGLPPRDPLTVPGNQDAIAAVA